jgi:hypothetical protein
VETGVKGKFSKRLEYTFDISNRIGNLGIETFFPQGTLKFKVSDWFRPSIDYRLIYRKEPNANYSGSNRLNFNLQFSKSFDRLNLGLRMRYQYSFNQLTSNYQPEFDKAFRMKPSISYDLNNSYLTPTASIEFFYNPTNGPLGKRFTKSRIFLGIEFEFKGPHGFELGYILDQSMNLPEPSTRQILNLSYTYKFEPAKKKGGKVTTIRNL